MEQEGGRSLRACTRKNYEDNLDDEIEGKRTFSVLEKLEDPKFWRTNFVQILPNGNDINLKYIQEHGFDSPFLFESSEGLGMRMPSSDFTVDDVKHLVGARRVVDVIDVNTQQQIEMSMMQFAKYYTNEAREKIYNVISLEFSHTRLENHVETPLLVRQLDWVDNVWPKELIRQQRDSTNNMDDMKYPKVRKYVLMSVKESYTDFHIDFCGSSVWYHIIRGKKLFWLIPPTEANLAIYENWVLSGKQQDVFLGDQVEKCGIIEIKAGNTFLMPSGWIHAVYTPEDSLVFGGNFIHNFNIERQFKICDIEESTRVPKKFRYPLHTEMMWHFVKQYTALLERDQQERNKETGASDDVVVNGTEGRPRRSGRAGTKNGEENKENMEQKDSVKAEKDNDGSEVVNGDNEGEGVPKTKPKKPWIPVCLTSREVEGLQLVVTRMKKWPKTSIPDSIENPDQLLNQLEEFLKLQRSNDPASTISGIHYMKQIIPDDEIDNARRSKSIRKPRKPSSSLRRRRVRCRACEACTREDCGECRYCKDMKKFGGPGVLKQSCTLRQCNDPSLPSTAMCRICEENLPDDDDTLMECASCGKIVHPTCLPAQGYYHIVPELNNCWKCPDCCDKHSGERFKGERLVARRSVEELKVAQAAAKLAPPAERTPKRKREGDESPGSAEGDESSENETSEEDSAPLATLAKKRRLNTPEIPFVPPQEITATYVIRPRPSSPPPETFELETGGSHVMTRGTWLKVFAYMTQHELCTCMAVSRTWNRWCMDKRFWTKIKLSVGRPITASALYGVVRRQPLYLDLSHTNITQQQLAWFLSRLPRLRDLILGATTFATVSAFSRVTCPPLIVLDLSWGEKITDHVIEDLLKPSSNGRRERPPGPGENTSRLRFLTDFRLAGCEVTDIGLRSIKRYLCCLSRLDLSYNVLITDDGVTSLLGADSTLHNNIKELNLAGCSHVSDTCFEALKKAPELDKLDVRKCVNVTADARESFKTLRTAVSVLHSL